jgi:hypothetical protein
MDNKEGLIMRPRKPSLAFRTLIAALAGASALDSASAANAGFGRGPHYLFDGGFLYRAPQPSKSQPSATSRPPSSDVRGAPL